MDRSYFEKYIKTVKEIATMYPAFTENTLRWWIFQVKSKMNTPTPYSDELAGFKESIIKINGRIYIDQFKFEKWITEKYLVPESSVTADTSPL
tara:strand:+ start:675 stop:953 length:279 start_codon:yes stop_codon:yes gene_type:complete